MALTATDIKKRLLEKGVSVAELARRWKTKREIVSRVIHRQGGVVYPDVRRKLAQYLGVSVAEVGREPIRKPKKNAA
jgi:ribosome-binding protein aMBF1 (putative translation factor)